MDFQVDKLEMINALGKEKDRSVPREEFPLHITC